MKKALLFLIIFILSFGLIAKSKTPGDSISVTKIWDKAPHNAFPDLIRFKNEFYCSIREGSSHMPDNSGKVRIIKSHDGNGWQSVALLEKEDMDVREARLSVTPDGKIMVLLAVGVYEKKYKTLYPWFHFQTVMELTFLSWRKPLWTWLRPWIGSGVLPGIRVLVMELYIRSRMMAGKLIF